MSSPIEKMIELELLGNKISRINITRIKITKEMVEKVFKELEIKK